MAIRGAQAPRFFPPTHFRVNPDERSDDGVFHKEMKYEFAANYAMPSGVDTDGALQFTAHSEEGNSITLYYKLERTP